MGSPVNNSRTVMVGDNLNSAIESTAIEELIQDASPQLGADLDCNGYDIQFDDGTGIEDDSGNKTLLFGKTVSATTYAKITNNATGTTGPLLEAAGETNVDFRLAAAGTGDVKVTTGGLRVTSDNESISVGAGNDLALAHDGSNSTITGGVGKITVTPAAGSVLELDNSNATVDNGSVQITGDLDVDNISIDGNTVSSTSGDLQLKAVSGASITFQDDADATKQLTLDFATISSGNERTWTFPDTNGTFGAGLSNIVEDTSPQLGGMLDVNGQALGDGTLELLKFSETGSAVNEFTIANAASGSGPTLSSTGTETNVDINITPKGTGDVVLAGDTVKVGDSGAAATLTSNGAGTLTVTTGGTTDLILNTNSGTNSGTIQITDGANGDIDFTCNGTGVINFNDRADYPQVAITSSSNATAWDAQAAPNAYHLTTENTTISAPSNAATGAFISLNIKYGGSHTMAFNTVFEFAASTAPTFTSTADKVDHLVFRYNGACWHEMGRNLNMAIS